MELKNLSKVFLFLAGALECGCGGTSSPTGTHVTWTSDGVAIKADGAKAIFSSDGTSDSVEITGFTTEAALSIAMTSPAPFAPATFKCKQPGAGQAISLSYSMGDASQDLNPQSCTVVISQIGKATGDLVVGTFEATFDKQAAGAMTLANGSFQLPLSM
jgi:hypothetical protein